MAGGPLCVDLTTREVLWRGWANSTSYLRPLEVFGGRLYVQNYDPEVGTHFAAIDAATGAVIWAGPKVEKSIGRAAVGYGLAFFRDSEGGLWALDADTGEVRWKASLSLLWGMPETGPLLVNDLVLVAVDGGELQAYAALTGELVWTLPGRHPGQHLSAMARFQFLRGASAGRLDGMFSLFLGSHKGIVLALS